MEYQAYVDSMQFQECIAGDMQEEIIKLDKVYPSDQGGIFVAYVDDAPLGCVALEKQAEGIAEIRRLYVRPQGRGKSLGKKLILRAVEEAKSLQYQRVRLDTFRAVDFAGKIYREAGFAEVAPYNHLPFDKVIFMEQVL